MKRTSKKGTKNEEHEYYFLFGATTMFLNGLFNGKDKELGGFLFETLLDEYKNRSEFNEVLFFSIATNYCRSNGHSIEDLKQAFMDGVPDSVHLLWMLDMLEKMKQVPGVPL